MFIILVVYSDARSEFSYKLLHSRDTQSFTQTFTLIFHDSKKPSALPAFYYIQLDADLYKTLKMFFCSILPLAPIKVLSKE